MTLACSWAQEKTDWTSMLWSIDGCQKGTRWPVSPGRIAGSGVDSLRSSIFWSYPLTSYWFSNDRRVKFIFKKNSYEICWVYVTLALHYLRFWFQTDLGLENSASYLKIQAGTPFSSPFTRWSPSASNFYVLIGQNLTAEFMRKIYSASWN